MDLITNCGNKSPLTEGTTSWETMVLGTIAITHNLGQICVNRKITTEIKKDRTDKSRSLAEREKSSE
jgi:hypothetical protein